jgi:glycosyltransferase-like protein LARGE
MSLLEEISGACEKLGGCVIASFLHELPQVFGDVDADGRDPAALAYDRLYPANALRNVAMEEAIGDLIFVLDVDFVPSRGLYASITNDCPGDIRNFLAPAEDGSARALVVPAFEMRLLSADRGDNLLPTNFAGLEELGERISGFHVGNFPQGHRATDFDRWRRFAHLSEKDSLPFSYRILYEEFFEPYVVLNRACAPRFDERFRGYGLNKCSFLRHCHAVGVQFEVLVQGANFVVAAEHKKSESWERNYGIDADPNGALKIAVVWRTFLRGLGVLRRDAATQEVSNQQAVLIPRSGVGTARPEITHHMMAHAVPMSSAVSAKA